MKNAYIYPNSSKKKEATNPYLSDFTSSLSTYFNFINKSDPSSSGILNFFKYVNKADIVFFHWIDDLPDKKGGLVQTIALTFLVLLMKLKRIKIFYTLHNKESHYPTHKLLKKYIRNLVGKSTDFVICHSREGLKFADRFTTRNIKYVPHPFRSFNENRSSIKEFDVLIWGSIHPYKGVDKYLNYLTTTSKDSKYRTLVVGKISSPEYEAELMKYNSKTVSIQNKYIDDIGLNGLISKSRVVLFTYNDTSVLSSGALVYSLSQGASVVGPKTGAFLDLNAEGIIEVYESYDELIKKIDFLIQNPGLYDKRIEAFVKNNSWKAFGKEISAWISGYNAFK
ncbi:MAG TPA: glycosyltransferase [Bacteroidales bacterium]|nr:glycosyltransferase [Bacteroidales bacterium]